MKSYIGIVRDHSASMAPHRSSAAEDYNIVISGIKESALEHGIDTIVSVVKCGVGSMARVEREIVLSSANALKPINNYNADGSRTPLWDSVGEAISIHEAVPDVNDNDVSFLMMIITDGHENHSHIWSAARLRNKIRELQATDRWSFAFRVPRGYARDLQRLLEVPAGNILEWEQTEVGFRQAAVSTNTAIRAYTQSLTAGKRSTQRFYADLGEVKPSTIKREMRDISNNVLIWTVPGPGNSVIKAFCEAMSGKPYMKGSAYYELVKTETVQDYKELLVRRRSDGKVYTGAAARSLLNLPPYGVIRLSPGDYGEWELFIQSTSLNRALAPGTRVIYRKSAIIV